ncbi:hypothetical protein NKR23_g2943 [Pleurostoma richardsiae]|uniref:Uncharacterized protein n=1 Tax=Pleurostoma richardsiae TaxID=41990 RepID=A0AA38RL70_9PEZI|nr:hypothetical protein NKR23_g2943 [Pleurostoma richardsiae]
METQASINTIWPSVTDGEIEAMGSHYANLLEYFNSELATIVENSDLFALAAPSEILRSIRELKLLGSVPRLEAIETLRRGFTTQTSSEDRILRSLDAAVRLWLTVNITSSGVRRPGLLVWTNEQTLGDLIALHFKQLSSSQGSVALDERVPPDLTADSLVNNYGFTVSWTHNLAAHLIIDWKHKIITIYEHKVCLQNHIRFPGNSLIPDDVLGEAIDTLNLLFPFQDDPTKRFLAKHKKPFYGLGFCNRPRKLELVEYRYWRNRIADLVDILKGPPVGLQQLRLERDGRNLLQFATFWIATAVGILTIVSIGIGVVSIVYSAKQYDLAVKQYELSVVQTCLDPSVRTQIPHICT